MFFNVPQPVHVLEASPYVIDFCIPLTACLNCIHPRKERVEAQAAVTWHSDLHDLAFFCEAISWSSVAGKSPRPTVSSTSPDREPVRVQ